MKVLIGLLLLFSGLAITDVEAARNRPLMERLGLKQAQVGEAGLKNGLPQQSISSNREPLHVSDVAQIIQTGDQGSERGHEYLLSIGGPANDDLVSISLTSDGGYIMTGMTESFGAGAQDVWVLKFDEAGSITWAKTFGGPDTDLGTCIRQTEDGGYLVVGTTCSLGAGSADILWLKLDASGNLLWARTIGGPAEEEIFDFQITVDQGAIATGYTLSFGAGDLDVLALKLSQTGDLVWAKCYGGPGLDNGTCIHQTNDLGYMCGAYSYSAGSGSADMLMIKLDAVGNPLWMKTYGGIQIETLLSFKPTSDAGFFVTGATKSYGSGYYQALLLRLDQNGTVLWASTTEGTIVTYPYDVVTTLDGGCVVAGYRLQGGDDILLLKYDALGMITWATTTHLYDLDEGLDIRLTKEGGYITTGIAVDQVTGYLNAFAMKTNELGLIQDCPNILSHKLNAFLHEVSISTPSLQTMAIEPVTAEVQCDMSEPVVPVTIYCAAFTSPTPTETPLYPATASPLPDTPTPSPTQALTPTTPAPILVPTTGPTGTLILIVIISALLIVAMLSNLVGSKQLES